MYQSINDANNAITEVISSDQPVLVDVVRAREVIEVLAGHAKVLMNSGPPIPYGEFTPPRPYL